MGSANVTLYAVWSLIPTYTVTYNNPASGSSGSVPTDSTSYQQGATVTVLNNTGNLVRTDNSFVEWNTAADGSGTTQATGSTFVMGSANVTLYAQWALNPWSGIKQIGTTGDDTGTGVAVDSSGNAYVTGLTYGAFTGTNAGDRDLFLTKYNSSGTQQWMRQIGTPQTDVGRDVAVDSSGNAYVTGLTYGALTGTNAGDYDIFLTKYDSSGTQQWMRQIGTPQTDVGRVVAVDSSGNVYVTGITQGALSGSNAGSRDIFLMKYDTSGNLQ